MRRAALCPWMLCCAASVFGAELPPPPEPGVRVEDAGDWTWTEAVLPGRLISYALPSAKDGRREIYLLVSPVNYQDEWERRKRKLEEQETEALAQEVVEAVEDATGREVSSDVAGEIAAQLEDQFRRIGPCEEPSSGPGHPLALYRLDADRRKLVLVRDDLPGDATALDAVDLDGDGGQELVLARKGALYSLAGNAMEPLLEEPDLSWRSLHPRATRSPALDGAPLVTVASLGHIDIYGPTDGQPGWSHLAEVELPLQGEVRGSGLMVRTAIPTLVGKRNDGTYLFATDPEAYGNSRLKTMLIEWKPSQEPTVTEVWSRLPAPEDVLDHHFLFIDDQPLLLVSAKPGDRLSLFGERRLRLYPMELDRSHLGIPPIFEVESHMNLWQDGTPIMVDVNGDGLEDLVMGYWKGLINHRIVLDAYVREPDGSFRRTPRTTAFDVKDGDTSFLQYGEDLNGDGFADLLLRSAEGWLLYSGQSSASGKNLVDKRPSPLGPGEIGRRGDRQIVVSLWGTQVHLLDPMAGRIPVVADLDGDGRHEVITVQAGSRGRPATFRFFGHGGGEAIAGAGAPSGTHR